MVSSYGILHCVLQGSRGFHKTLYGTVGALLIRRGFLGPIILELEKGTPNIVLVIIKAPILGFHWALQCFRKGSAVTNHSGSANYGTGFRCFRVRV